MLFYIRLNSFVYIVCIFSFSKLLKLIYWTAGKYSLQSIGLAMFFRKTDLGFEFILTARRSIEDHFIMSVYIIIHKIFNLGWSFRHWSTMIWIKHGIIPSNHFSNCKKCIKTLNIWKQLCVTIKINNNIKQDICEQMLASDTPTLSIFK